MKRQVLRLALLVLAAASVVISEPLRLADYAPAPVAHYVSGHGVAYATSSFTRSCSVTGGSAQQLSAVLTACGYSGAVSLQELTIKNPDDAANDLYLGQSDVNSTNGYRLLAGDSTTKRAASQSDQIEAGRLYLFVASTQNVHISLRSK